jgi:hypothetical protein
MTAPHDREPCPYPSRGELEAALLAAELEALAALQEAS